MTCHKCTHSRLVAASSIGPDKATYECRQGPPSATPNGIGQFPNVRGDMSCAQFSDGVSWWRKILERLPWLSSR